MKTVLPKNPTLLHTDPSVTHQITGLFRPSPTDYRAPFTGYYTRETVGAAMEEALDIDPNADLHVSPYNWHLNRPGESSPLRSSDVEWIVNSFGELGVKIGDQYFFLYRGESLMYYKDSPIPMYRHVTEREFGETVKAHDRSRYTRMNDGSYQYDIDLREHGWEEINPLSANNVLAYHNRSEENWEGETQKESENRLLGHLSHRGKNDLFDQLNAFASEHARVAYGRKYVFHPHDDPAFWSDTNRRPFLQKMEEISTQMLRQLTIHIQNSLVEESDRTE